MHRHHPSLVVRQLVVPNTLARLLHAVLPLSVVHLQTCWCSRLEEVHLLLLLWVELRIEGRNPPAVAEAESSANTASKL